MEPDTRFDALVDLMLTVGYVDGTFDQREQAFVHGYLAQLVAHVASVSSPAAGEAQRKHFEKLYVRLEAEIAGLAAEVMSAGDSNYVTNRLKVRAVALFRALPASAQDLAIELVDGIVAADGTIAPIERGLRDELVTYFQASRPAAAPGPAVPPAELLTIEQAKPLKLTVTSDPLLEPLEKGYPSDPDDRKVLVDADHELIFQAILAWERQRARGTGRLAGINDISQLPLGTRLLDGHIHVMRPDQPTELIVLGDLHGCYSCLKGALLQSNFIAHARRHQEDPKNFPDIKLVLLGDYLDRGRFGFEGVLRAALKLFVTFPDNVVLLRGNHEFLVRRGDAVVSAVMPAEAVPSITGLVANEVLEAYRYLFEHMPTALLFDRTLFVHGGIPRDATMLERYRDLGSLDDPSLRFEMMWSDPVETDFVPAELQRESTRFSFGREQFRIFMERIGCHALIRGHEQLDAGFVRSLDVAGRQLYTLFSAGGDNPDLPADSRYRKVTPMALTIRRETTSLRGTAWPIQYQTFIDGDHNGLYR